MIKKIGITVLSLLFFAGCETTNTDSGALNVDSPTPQGSPTIDPTSLTWTIEGPTGTVGSNTCAGPFFVVASENLATDYVLTLAAQNTVATAFYSDSGCSQSTSTSTVGTGSEFSAPFYFIDSTTSVEEIVSVTATGPGQDDPLASLDVQVSEYP